MLQGIRPGATVRAGRGVGVHPYRQVDSTRFDRVLEKVALGGLLACLVACGSGSGDVDESFLAGDQLALALHSTVATFELAAPSVSDFVLHGTLPVPRGLILNAQGPSPFKVVDIDGTHVSAQIEIVSRYASPSDGADVVELLAHVHCDPASEPGDRLRYDVVYEPHRRLHHHTAPSVALLLETPGKLQLRTRDVFGNAYSVDPLRDTLLHDADSTRVLRKGAYAEQIVAHTTLMPEEPHTGPQGTLPHMMGVHSYVTRWADEEFFSLDLRVHNAGSGLAPADVADDPLGKIYFQSLELRLPQGWVVSGAYSDPYLGAPYDEGSWRVWPIVMPLADDDMHVMLAMAQFQRRLVISKTGEAHERALSVLREEGLAFCQPGASETGETYFSWWNKATARYFPQRTRLPELAHLSAASMRAMDISTLAMRIQQVASGSSGLWPAESHGMGWAHPWGIGDGGMVSGEEIYLIDGVTTAWAASTAGYRMFQLQHRMYTDRQPNVLYNTDGRPTAMQQWTKHTLQGTPYLPVWWFNSPMLWAADPFGYNASPSFQRDAVVAQGRVPSYEAELTSFDPVDQAHLIRYTHSPKVLVWLGNDALAKDDLLAQAEGIRFAYPSIPQDQWGSAIVSGLLAARNYVDEYPAQGFPYSRAQGWGLDVMNAAYSTQDASWRNMTRDWFFQNTDLVEDGQTACSGIIQATPFINVFDAQYRARQSIEAAIIENALVGMRESVFAGAHPTRVAQVETVLRNAFYAMIGPLVWSDAQPGPWAMVATGSIDMTLPPYCTWSPDDGNYGYPDLFQMWPSLAAGYRLTADPTFLDKAADALGGPLLETLLAEGLENINNRAPLIALAQELSGTTQTDN